MALPRLLLPRRFRVALLAGVFVRSLVFGLVAHFTLERATHRDRVLRNVTASGVALSGMTEDEARTELARSASRLRERHVRVSIDGRPFEVRASAIGLELDVASTARAALSAGRDQSLGRQVVFWLGRLITEHSVPLATRVDTARAFALFEAFERSALGEPPSEGAVTYSDRLEVTYAREGRRLSRAEAVRRVQRALSGDPTEEAIELPVIHHKARLTRDQVDAAHRIAERWLRGPLLLMERGGESRITLSEADLGRALRSRPIFSPSPRLEVYFDEGGILRALAAHRPELERPAKSARFVVDARNEITIEPSELGTRLDDAATFEAIVRAASSESRQAELVFAEDVVPELTTEQAEALRIQKLVSKFTTYFPCCEARVKNIARIGNLVDGTILAPGERFSLNATSGPRTLANGFVAGPTIVDGEMEMTVGGGVSQFATTLFNAVLDAGYEIVQRQPHTYYFPRYPEGHEATVSFPTPDLIFRNDTAAGVLIKTDVGKKHVRVLLFGDNEGRKVERRVSSRFDIVQPPVEFLPNPAVAPHSAKLKYSGTVGWSVHTSRILTFPDGRTKEERRKVVYNPRARRVETHPCRIPEGHPGYTGDKCPEPERPDGGTEGNPS